MQKRFAYQTGDRLSEREGVIGRPSAKQRAFRFPLREEIKEGGGLGGRGDAFASEIVIETKAIALPVGNDKGRAAKIKSPHDITPAQTDGWIL